MHIYEYFLWLCNRQGVEEPEAYKGCHINRSSFSRWKSAFLEGRDMEFSAKAASGISDYFNIPLDHVIKMEDERGLTPDDWKMLGFAYSSYRMSVGASIAYVSSSAEISEEKIIAFENEGSPVPKWDLVVMCGVLNGATLDDVFHGFARRFEEDAKSTLSYDHQIEDDFTYAAHKYSGKLREEDKATIVKMMETLAAANAKDNKHGETY